LVSVKNISGVVSDIVKLPVTVAPVEVVASFSELLKYNSTSAFALATMA